MFYFSPGVQVDMHEKMRTPSKFAWQKSAAVKLLRRLAVWFAICLMPFSAYAQVAKTAQVTVDAKAIELFPSTPVFVAGAGNVTSFFSTFNGNTGTLLIDVAHGGVVSGELRPRAGAVGLYEGGYAQATPVALLDYGSYVVSIPTTDA